MNGLRVKRAAVGTARLSTYEWSVIRQRILIPTFVELGVGGGILLEPCGGECSRVPHAEQNHVPER